MNMKCVDMMGWSRLDGQCGPQQSDSWEEINKNYIGDYKRAECHRTLLSEIKDGGMETLHTTITHNAQQSEH